MAYNDPKAAFEHLHSETVEALKTHFPIVGKKHTVRVDKFSLGELLDPGDIRAQAQKKMEGGTFAVPLHGHVQLVDNETGKVIEERKLHLMDLPQMTNRFSYVVGGKEYQVANQWQSRPGAYTKRGQNGELSTRFNVLNRNQFDLTFKPDTSSVEFEVKSAKLPVYPLLRALGASDATIEKRVGADAFKAMKDARGASSALKQFFKTTTRRDATDDAEAEKHFQTQMLESVMDPVVTKHTLGAEMSHVTADTLLRSIEKLQRVHNGAPEDDKDSLVFKNLRSIGDFAGDKIRAHSKAVQQKVGRQLAAGGTIRRVIPAGLFNAPMRETFTDNAASELASQINPVEMIGKNYQTTVLGPGGISSENKILDSVKLINRSHLGFQDTVVTPESGRTGVNLRLPIGLQKHGRDAKVAVYNLQTGGPEFIDTATFLRSNVVLPDQVVWKGGKPVPVSPKVKVAGRDNEVQEMAFGDAHYTMRHPSQVFSTTTNLIPFLPNVSGNRASMAARHIEQSISLTDREAPLVQPASGSDNVGQRTFHEVIGRQSAHVSPFEGEVVGVKADGIHVRTPNGVREVQIYNHFPLNDTKSTLHSTPVVKVGDHVTKGQLLADTNYTKNGVLALGKNMRVAYLPFRGLNFEDGIVISETAAKKLTSNHLYKDHVAVNPDTILSKKGFMYHVGAGFTKDQVDRIADDGVVTVGTKLRPGDPMVLALQPYDLKSRTDLKSVHRALLGSHVDRSLRWHGDVEGEVVGVHRGKDGIHVHVTTTEAARVGDKLSNASAGKGVISMIVPDSQMPHSTDGKPIEVALNPCYDDQTEFLTARGWVKGPELADGDVFATVNKETLFLEYQRPVNGVYRWDYKGKMYRLWNAQLDLCVTPNHKNFVAPRVPGSLGHLDLADIPKGTFRLEEAQEGFGKARRHLKAARWEGTFVGTVAIAPGTQKTTGPKNKGLRVPVMEFAEFMGWYLAEGYCSKNKQSGAYTVAVTQSRAANPEKYARIVELFRRMGLKPTECEGEVTTCHKGLFEYLKPLGYQHERYIPDDVQQLPSDALRVFLDAYLLGDGSVRHRPEDGHYGTVRFSTVSTRLADGLQLLAFKLGLVVNVHPPKSRAERNDRPCHELALGARTRAPWANWSNETKENQVEEWVDYDGVVYCTEVPNGTLVVRRNGKVVISGNSGVPGRMNPSQLLETAASKIALKTGKTFIVPNFKHGYNAVDHVQSELKKHGLSDKEELIDPISKESLGPVMVGHQHMFKLVHQADKKISAAPGMGLPGVPGGATYDGTLQSKSGSRLGSLGTYALLAHGAVHNLREFQTFKGEGIDPETDERKQWHSQHLEVWNAIQTGSPLPLPKSSYAFHKFTEMLKASGINVEKKGHDFIASPLTDKNVLELAGNRVLTKPGDIVNAKIDTATGQLQTRAGGLFDPNLTGGHNGKKWSRIQLHEPMPNPIFEAPIKSLTGLSTEQFTDIISGKKGINAVGAVVAFDGAAHIGGHAIEHLLKGIDVHKELEATKKALTNAPISKVDVLLKKAKYLAALNTLGMKADEAYVMKNVAVLPPAFRPVSVLGDGKNINFGDVNRIYQSVGLFNEKMKSPLLEATPELKSELRSSLYDAIQQVSGNGIPYDKAKHKGLLHSIAGSAPKAGFFQKRVTQKRQDLSLNAVITPEPPLGLDQVGLPRTAALELFRPFVVQKLQEMGYAKNPLDAQKLLAQGGAESYTALERVVADRPVLVKRDPALHKYSIQGFDVKLVEGNTMKMHPLVCGGFTADFDGDVMRAYVPISKDAVNEAHRMKPSQNLFAESTGQVRYGPTLDSARGIYKMSVAGKDTKKTFDTTQHVLAAAQAKSIHPTDIVYVGGKPTTAARVLLADAAPSGMRDKLLHNVHEHIDGKRLKALYTEIGKNHREEFSKSADALKDIGNHASFGVVPIPGTKGYLNIGAHTLSLDDMKSIGNVRDPVMRHAHSDVAAIRKEFGTNPDSDAKVVTRYQVAEQELKNHIQKIDHTEGNNLHAMYLAGVKPGWEQYKQLIIGPLLLSDSTGKIIPTPVTRSYSEGLDVAGYWTQMHGARKGSVQKVQEVSDPGALTKLVMQSTINTVVANHDCGTQKGVLLPVREPDVHDRVLARDFTHGKLHVTAGTIMTPRVVDSIRTADAEAKILVRSPLRCEHSNGICQKCAGVSANGNLHPVGTNLGVIASQTVGERAVQLMLKSFHSGGAAAIGGSGALIGGFKRLEQLTTLPEKIPNSAVLAMRSGTVNKVDTIATGVNIFVDGEKHFVGKDSTGLGLDQPHVGSTWVAPKVGGTVKAGQHLSDPARTTVNPRHLYQATGSIETVQNHLADELHKLYADENVKRRHLETVVRGITSITKVVDPGGASGILRGEFKPLASVNSLNRELAKAGRPLIEHTPTIRGVETVPFDLQDDWIAKLQHRRIIDTITGAAALGSAAHIHGTHPITGLAYGARFGLTSKHHLKPGLLDHKDVPEHFY